MPPGDMLLSIVILSWNRRDDLRTTLEHVLQDEYRPGEIFVVDNGSTDGSAEMVNTVFPHVRLVQLPDNFGIEGLNVGLRAAKGEIIVLLDDDSYPASGALRQLVEIFQNDASLGVAACRITGPRDWDTTWPWRDPGAEVPTFVGCGVGIRRAALDRAGLFDRSFFLYQNEIDLAARIMAAGYTVRYFPDIVFVHAVSPANRPSLRADYYDTRNLLWVIWKYFPFGQALWLSLRVAGEGVGYRLMRRDLSRACAVGRAVWEAAAVLPGLPRSVLRTEIRRKLLMYIDRWYPPLWSWLQARLLRWQ
jgi:GT2 family glycosyltransferase